MQNLNVLLSATLLGLMLAACGHSNSVAVGAPGMPGPVTPDPTGMPKTIPALREWQAGTGAFQFADNSRIIIAATNEAELRPVAEVFAEDLFVQNGTVVAVLSNAATAARAGDISLSLGESDTRAGHEGYRMTVGPVLAIKAAEAAGAFYGTRSVLQLLHQNRKIQAGEALDWPRYPERGLMVDTGGKFYTPGWIKAHLKDLAYLKLNYFHLHFSETIGFRVESTTHPEIVQPDHLSKQEVRDIVALAGRYHITVVPEIDMPGHMPLTAHPEFQLKDVFGQSAADKLDITNPAALQFARELIEEYLPLFPGPFWHIGGDEYMPEAQLQSYPQLQAYAQAQYGPNANAKDAIRGFFNWEDAIVRSHGKTARAWHDEMNGGSAVTVNPDIIVEWWVNFDPLSDPQPPTVKTLLDRGHRIMNCSDWPTYYNVGGLGGGPPSVPPVVDMCTTYQTWTLSQFQGAEYTPTVVPCQQQHLPSEEISPDEVRNLGSKLHVWHFDVKAETQAQTADAIFPRLRVIAQKTWESSPLTPAYSEFQPIMDAIGHAPGYSIQ